MRIFCIVLMWLVVSTAARAETVFFCESTNFVIVKEGVEEYRNEKFKIKVTSDKIRFSGDGYFGSSETNHREYVNDGTWIAGGTFGTTSLREGPQFLHAYNSFSDNFLVAIKGECSKF